MPSLLFAEPLPRRPESKLDYLLAALICAGLVALLVYGFKFRPSSNLGPEDHKPQLATIVMLPVGGDTSKIPIEQRGFFRSLEAWADLRDPTLISLPNDAYGFSEILRIGAERPLQTVEDSDPTLELAPSVRLVALSVATPAISPVASLAASRLREPLTLPALIEPEKPAPGVYWTTPDGVVFRRLPPLELPPVAEGEAPYACDRPTRLCVLPSPSALDNPHGPDELDADLASGLVHVNQDYEIRVELTTSCGDKRLDQLAVDHVRRHLANFPDRLEVDNDLRWWLGGKHQLVIHWRFADGVRNTADPLSKEVWHDRSWY